MDVNEELGRLADEYESARSTWHHSSKPGEPRYCEVEVIDCDGDWAGWEEPIPVVDSDYLHARMIRRRDRLAAIMRDRGVAELHHKGGVYYLDDDGKLRVGQCQPGTVAIPR